MVALFPHVYIFYHFSEVDIEAQFSLNQSRAEEITMREDYGSLNLVTHDDGFGDMGFDTDNPDIMREAIGNEGGLEQVCEEVYKIITNESWFP